MTAILRCPHDGEPLLERSHGAGQYHQCTGCHGIWVSRTFLRGLARAEAKRAFIKDYPEPVHFSDTTNCPACAEEMVHRVQEKVQIDLCPKCRCIWLDGGEILHIAGALDAQAKKDAQEHRTEHHIDRGAGAGSAAEVALDLIIHTAAEIIDS